MARRNLELIAPELSPDERERRVGEILRATGSNAMETLRVWTRPRAAQPGAGSRACMAGNCSRTRWPRAAG